MLAPIAAVIVLVGGIGYLVTRGGATDPPPTGLPRIAEVGDPDSPLVQSTVPTQTSPPLVEPTSTEVSDPTTSTAATTTTTSSTTTTVAQVSGGPTQTELDAALLQIPDLGDGDWSKEIPDFSDVCGTVLDEEVIEARSDALFQTLVTDPIGVRQISNSLVTFSDAATAEKAFLDDVALLEACDATTIDLDGVGYRVQVDTDSFSEEDLSAFPCSDQSSFLVLQLTNANAVVPFIAQSAIGFRCGQNITVTALTTTIDLADLEQPDFFTAAATSNTRTGALPGS